MTATQIKAQAKTLTAKEFYNFCDGSNIPFTFSLGVDKYDGVKISLKGENYQVDLKDGQLRKGKTYALLTPGSKVSYIEHSPIAFPKDATAKTKNKKDKPSDEIIIPQVVTELKTEVEPIATPKNDYLALADEIKPSTPIAPIQPTEVDQPATIPDAIVSTQMIDWLEQSGDIHLLAKLCRLQSEFLQKMSQQLNGPTEVEVAPIATTPKTSTPAVTPTPKNTKNDSAGKPKTKKADNNARDRFDAIIRATNFLASRTNLGGKTSEQDKIDAKEKFYWVEFNPEKPSEGLGQFNQYISAMNWTRAMVSKLNPRSVFDAEQLADRLAAKFTFNEWLEIYTKEKVCKGTDEQKAEHILAVAEKYYSNFQ